MSVSENKRIVIKSIILFRQNAANIAMLLSLFCKYLAFSTKKVKPESKLFEYCIHISKLNRLLIPDDNLIAIKPTYHQ